VEKRDKIGVYSRVVMRVESGKAFIGRMREDENENEMVLNRMNGLEERSINNE